MPASTADPISSTLKRSFGNHSKLLEEGLESALTKRSLVPVPFDPPSRISTNSPLKHYIILNSESGLSTCKANGTQEDSASPVSIPKPKVTFYKREDVKVGYQGPFSPGAGMMNVGNTCYLNSTLQALFHTPSLINYLTDGHHRCNNGGSGGYSIHSCTICALSLTLKDTHRTNIVRPSRVYEKLKTICKHLVHGRQEDAHEFLRYLIESLQKSFLISAKAKNLDSASKETTPFNQIFGGYMRQDVTCVRCKYVSTTFQHFMDLLLDIRSASNIEEALAHYFRSEKLGGMDGSNMYKCEKCKVKVPAHKASFIERPPVVLCIQLKRFALTGGKISKPVQLSRRLEVSRFVRGGMAKGNKLEYRLVSMITHVGPSPNCGHYTAIGEASNGQFYQFDDSHVRPVPVSQALNTASYVVMYEMTQATHCHWTKQPQTNQILQPPPPSTTLVSINKQMRDDAKNHFNNSSHVNHAKNSGTINGMHKPPLPSPISSLPKKLVPYDELDSSSTEDEDKSNATNNHSHREVTKSQNGLNENNQPHLSNGDASKNGCNNGKRVYSNSSGFLPMSIALKHQQISSDEKRVSASGTWTVVDMDHHNPSIHSDNSSSSGGQWRIHNLQNKRSDSDTEAASRGPIWNVKQTSTNSDSEVGSPKKVKKMITVKEAISKISRLFPQKNKSVSSVLNGNDTRGGSSEGHHKNDNTSPSSSRNTNSNNSHASQISTSENEGGGMDHDEERGSSLNRKESHEDDIRKKKRKKSFSNGFDESPSKKYINSSDSRWSSSSNNGGGHSNGNGGNSNVVDELIRQSSLSDKVTSWNGSKSSTFSSSFNYNRSRSDSRDRYDEEMDRGRTKKIKRRHSDTLPYHSSSSNGMNPFQAAQQNGFHHSNSYHHSHHHRNSSSYKDYNNRHHRRPYHHRNSLRNSHGGSFNEENFRKGGGSSYRQNDYHHRSRR